MIYVFLYLLVGFAFMLSIAYYDNTKIVSEEHYNSLGEDRNKQAIPIWMFYLCVIIWPIVALITIFEIFSKLSLGCADKFNELIDSKNKDKEDEEDKES